jgi:hypothetical protein
LIRLSYFQEQQSSPKPNRALLPKAGEANPQIELEPLHLSEWLEQLHLSDWLEQLHLSDWLEKLHLRSWLAHLPTAVPITATPRSAHL